MNLVHTNFLSLHDEWENATPAELRSLFTRKKGEENAVNLFSFQIDWALNENARQIEFIFDCRYCCLRDIKIETIQVN